MKQANGPCVAILGATGLVGEEILRLLEERRFPVGELRPLASARSAHRSVQFHGEKVPIQEVSDEALATADIVLASAGGSVSKAFLPKAGAAGAICIDNTSAFRMDPEVPLVVPEINANRIAGAREGKGIIANPNCSTIQLVVALKPLHDAAGVKSVVVSTYQSVSGAGRMAVEEFRKATGEVLKGAKDEHERFPRPIAFNAIPEIGDLDPEGDTTEEKKMIGETAKILESDLAVDVICVRIPTITSHAESVLVKTERPLSVADARELFAAAPGVHLSDGKEYPTPRESAGTSEVYVGRIRRSRTTENGLFMWVVADNLLKGAALNAVQIAEQLVAPGGLLASKVGEAGVTE